VSGFSVALAQQQRFAGVAALPKRRIERHAAEERNPELVGELLSAARTEDLAGHVLDNADEPHSGLLRHHAGSRRDLLRGGLRRRNDDRLCPRQELTE
jgi:hypothetical protein